MKNAVFAAAVALISTAVATAGADEQHKLVVAYQTGAAPYIAGIASGDLAKATGWQIDFKRFDSGADILAAVASGDVQIGDVGSSPFAAAVSRGLDVKAVYITAGAGEDEALVVRPDIKSPSDLRGKKLAAAPVSTDHYMLLATLKQAGIAEKNAQVIAIPQPEIVAAWKRGDIDGGFVWDPALAELKKTGHVLLTAQQVADQGAPTFGALVVTGSFAKQHPDAITRYVHAVDGYFESLRNDPSAWTAESANVKLIAGLQGGTPAENADRLRATHTVPLKDQISEAWLSGGERSGVAKVLADTAQFLKGQHKITRVQASYGAYVAPAFADESQRLVN